MTLGRKYGDRTVDRRTLLDEAKSASLNRLPTGLLFAHIAGDLMLLAIFLASFSGVEKSLINSKIRFAVLDIVELDWSAP